MSEEEFNLNGLDLDLGDEAHARIEHAEFLEKVKDWGKMLAMIVAPFANMANSVIALHGDLESDNPEAVAKAIKFKEDLYERVATGMVSGVSLTVEHINDFYRMIQQEAIKVIGAPFALHDSHTDECDGTTETCGHQDHFTEGNA